MFKVLGLIFALFVASNAFAVGGFQSAAVTDDVLAIARWTSSQLSGYTNIAGDHTVMTVRNLKTQVVSGVNYRFTLDVLIQGEDNKYFVRFFLLNNFY